MTLPVDVGSGTTTGHLSHTNTLHRKANRTIDLKIDFGAVGDGATDDSVRFADAMDAAVADNAELFLGDGVFLVDNGQVWNGPNPMIRGLNSKDSQLKFPSNTDDGLVLGDNTTSPIPSGYAQGFGVFGSGAPATPNFKAGLVINGTEFFKVADTYVGGFDVGYDPRNNPHGTTYTRASSRFSDCNVAFRMRLGTQSGNDLVLVDCWLGGKHAGIVQEPDSGGLTVLGGQLFGNPSSSDDNAAAVVLGRNYETGATGQTANTRMNAASFEGINNAWAIRNFGSASVDLWGCVYHDNAGDLGFFKSSGGTIYYTSTGLHLLDHASFSSPLAVVSGGTLVGTEIQTRGDTTVGGGSVNMHTVQGVFGESSISATWLG